MVSLIIIIILTHGIFFFLAILHYRTFRNNRKRDLKNQHAIIHGCIIILVSLAGWAAYASHIYSDPPIPNFYSLHSWLGVLTILMFLSQVSRLLLIILNKCVLLNIFFLNLLYF